MRERRIAIAIGFGLLLTILWVTTSPTAAMPASQDAELAEQAAAMLERYNQVRLDNGLEPYVLNPLLQQAAQGHAEEIAEFAHYSHTSRDGRKAEDRVIATGYAAGRAGLRVGENFVGRSTIDDAFGWLMEDPPHRANILHPDYREIGVGVGKISYGYIWVIDTGDYDGIEDALAASDSAESPESAATEPSDEPIEAAKAPAATATLGPISTLAPAAEEPVAAIEGEPIGDPGQEAVEAAPEGETASTSRTLLYAALIALALGALVASQRVIGQRR